MFYIPKYQSGEAELVAKELKKGIIPCLEVTDMEEFELFTKLLKNFGIYFIENWELNRKARDGVKEPEFEFRAAFYSDKINISDVEKEKMMFLDVYFEATFEETYDSCGEM